MNDQQPEALRLAGILGDHYFYSDTNEAAAELRRLYEENVQITAKLGHATRRALAHKECADELLEALKKLMREWDTPSEYLEAARNARSAIAKAEEEKS